MQRTCGFSMKRQYGFTIIELGLVLVLVGLLLNLAVPAFGKLIEKRRLIGAAEKVFEQVLYARTEAIKRSKAIVVDVYVSGNAWAVGVTDKSAGCEANLTSGASACRPSPSTTARRSPGRAAARWPRSGSPTSGGTAPEEPAQRGNARPTTRFAGTPAG